MHCDTESKINVLYMCLEQCRIHCIVVLHFYYYRFSSNDACLSSLRSLGDPMNWCRSVLEYTISCFPLISRQESTLNTPTKCKRRNLSTRVVTLLVRSMVFSFLPGASLSAWRTTLTVWWTTRPTPSRKRFDVITVLLQTRISTDISYRSTS